MKTLFRKILLPASALLLTFFIGLNWSVLVGTQKSSNDESAIEHAQLHTDPTYVCPMHSQVTDTEASACPICGMDLELREISVPSGNNKAPSDSVYVSPAMMNNLGVRLVHAEIGSVSEQVYATGYVESVSDARIEKIVSKVNAPIYEILVEPGQWVEEGQVLMTIDVEGFYESMLEYVDAMENGKIRKALKLRSKFEAMGAGTAALAGFAESGTPLSKYLEIVAPFDGEVSEVFAKDGNIQIDDDLATVTAPALAVANLHSYSHLARNIKIGSRGRLNVAHMKGRTWTGRVVEIIHNTAGFYTTLSFHIEVPLGVLEAGAFAGAYVNAKGAENVLRVPSSAVIHDENSVRVIRMTDDEYFDAVEVDIGFEGNTWTEVKSGLNEGDHIVSRGQFLIDSESTLQAGFKRLSQ